MTAPYSQYHSIPDFSSEPFSLIRSSLVSAKPSEIPDEKAAIEHIKKSCGLKSEIKDVPQSTHRDVNAFPVMPSVLPRYTFFLFDPTNANNFRRVVYYTSITFETVYRRFEIAPTTSVTVYQFSSDVSFNMDDYGQVQNAALALLDQSEPIKAGPETPITAGGDECFLLIEQGNVWSLILLSRWGSAMTVSRQQFGKANWKSADVADVQVWSLQQNGYARWQGLDVYPVVSAAPVPMEYLERLWKSLETPLQVSAAWLPVLERQVGSDHGVCVVGDHDENAVMTSGMLEVSNAISQSYVEENPRADDLRELSRRMISPLRVHSRQDSPVVMCGELTRWECYIRVAYPNNITAKWYPMLGRHFEYSGTILPFLVFKIISFKNESDRWRLLAQCKVYLRLAALLQVRIGQDLRSARPVVMACYMPKNMMLEVYLMTTMDDSDDIMALRIIYDMRKPTERCRLLLACHRFLSFQKSFTDEQKKRFSRVHSLLTFAGGSLISQTATEQSLRSRANDEDGGGNEDSSLTDLSSDWPILKHEKSLTDLSSDLEALDVVDFRPILKHKKHLAFCTYHDGRKGVLKLVPPKGKEVLVLKKLLAINDPSNPILPDMYISQLPSAPSYHLIHMPRGTRIDYQSNQTVDLLALATQLVSGIMFLHAHHIAHLDIKRDNLLLSRAGRLHIIDFSVSRFTRSKTIFTGFWGTRGYVAPEIEQGRPFSPFLADVWACGNILREMCEECPQSPWIAVIALQARFLTAADPSRRPPLHRILDALETARQYPLDTSKMIISSVTSGTFTMVE